MKKPPILGTRPMTPKEKEMARGCLDVVIWLAVGLALVKKVGPA